MTVSDAIDYRALLKKYMDHVGNEEGVRYVSLCHTELPLDDRQVTIFTPEEIAELEAIEDEIMAASSDDDR